MKKALALLTVCIMMTSAACSVDPRRPSGDSIPTKKQTEAPTEYISESESASEEPTEEPVEPVTHLEPLIPEGTVETDSLAYCVLDEDGAAILSKNPFQRMRPADLSKVMTALLVIEKCELSEEVTVTESAARSIVIRPWFTAPPLRAGDVFTVEELLQLIFADSSDAAANALAEHAAGRMNLFAEEMNARARKLGMGNTNFTNPSGLDEDGQYTCAYDMALLMKAACENETLAALMADDEGFTARKDGESVGAKYCCMASQEREGAKVFGAALYSDDNVADYDLKNLYEYAFAEILGTAVTPFGYVYDIKLTDDFSPVLTYKEATGANVDRVVFWNKELGTSHAVFNTEPDGEAGIPLHLHDVGPYYLQIISILPDKTEVHQVPQILFRGGYNVYGAINRIGDREYYLNENGFLESGVIVTDAGCRLSDDDGVLFYDGIYENDGTFYVNADGIIESGFKEIDGKTYYFGADGQMVTGKTVIGNRSYEFGEDGVLISK